jgi:hypothetical protein
MSRLVEWSTAPSDRLFGPVCCAKQGKYGLCSDSQVADGDSRIGFGTFPRRRGRAVCTIQA